MNVSHLFLFTVNAPQNVTNLMTFFAFSRVISFAIACIYLTFSMLTLLPVFVQQCLRCGFVKLTKLNGFSKSRFTFRVSL